MRAADRRAYHRVRWQRLRKEIKDRDGWRCTRCRRIGRLEVHHVVAPRDGGGMYDAGNLQTLCRDCHCEIHRKQLQDRLDPDMKARLAFINRA